MYSMLYNVCMWTSLILITVGSMIKSGFLPTNTHFGTMVLIAGIAGIAGTMYKSLKLMDRRDRELEAQLEKRKSPRSGPIS